MKHDFYADKNILITGGLGFLGSNLAIRLVELEASVTLYDGMIPDLGANTFNIEPIKERVEVITGNVGDRSVMDRHVSGQDIIFNIGMHSCHLDSMKNPVFDIVGRVPNTAKSRSRPLLRRPLSTRWTYTLCLNRPWSGTTCYTARYPGFDPHPCV
jgi:hypothetical protein